MFLPVKSVNDMVRSLLTIAGLTNGGSELVSDTTSREGNFVSFMFVTDTTFTSLTGNHVGWEGTTYSAGMVLNGLFTEFQLSSGSVLVYKEVI